MNPLHPILQNNVFMEAPVSVVVMCLAMTLCLTAHDKKDSGSWESVFSNDSVNILMYVSTFYEVY